MLPADAIALAPYILLATGGLIVLAAGVWPRRLPDVVLLTITLTFLLAAAGAAALLWDTPRNIEGMLVIDEVGRLFTVLFTLGTAAVAILSHGYRPTANEMREEYWSLLLFATLGMTLLATSGHLITAFLGLEILAVPLYALIAWRPGRPGAIEGGVKYAVLAGLSASFFLYGIALAYADSGTLNLAALGVAYSQHLGAWFTMAITLLLVAVGFKLALVPFHMWVPDIYQAAPAPVTALFATVVKAALLAFLVRLLTLQLPLAWEAMQPLLWGLAVVTMLVGNILALLQQNLKRLLAYSSIAHLGYILVAFAAGNPLGRDAVIYYAVAYVVMNLGAFGVIAALSHGERDREQLSEYRGLGRQYPLLGLGMGISLLALAGLPPTAGFMAKLLAFGAAVQAGHMVLAVIAVLNTALAFFYYLRVMLVFYDKGKTAPGVVTPGRAMVAVVIVAAALVITLGIFPQWILGAY